MKPYKIQEPRKIIWSIIPEYIHRFIDLVELRAKSNGDEAEFERLKRAALYEKRSELENCDESYMYTDRDIIMIGYIEKPDGSPDKSTMFTRSYGDNDIGRIFRADCYWNVPNIVYGIDTHKNLVAKEIREVSGPAGIDIWRYLYRALKKGVTVDQYYNFVDKVERGLVTSQDISRYTEAIGWRLL